MLMLVLKHACGYLPQHHRDGFPSQKGGGPISSFADTRFWHGGMMLWRAEFWLCWKASHSGRVPAKPLTEVARAVTLRSTLPTDFCCHLLRGGDKELQRGLSMTPR